MTTAAGWQCTWGGATTSFAGAAEICCATPTN
jgi:hypothetical protein